MPMVNVRPSIAAGAITLRQRKKEATARVIVDAAYELFAAAGYDVVTVEQIADSASISPRTVYRYFPTKAAIVFELQASWMSVFLEAASLRISGEQVMTTLRRIATAVAVHVQANPAQALVAYRITEQSAELQAMSLGWEREWREAVAAVAGSWERSRALPMAGAVMGVISSTLEMWLQHGGRDDLVEMIDRGFDALETGWRDEAPGA